MKRYCTKNNLDPAEIDDSLTYYEALEELKKLVPLTIEEQIKKWSPYIDQHHGYEKKAKTYIRVTKRRPVRKVHKFRRGSMYQKFYYASTQRGYRCTPIKCRKACAYFHRFGYNVKKVKEDLCRTCSTRMNIL